MIKRIKTHNLLNGLKFSITEFIVIAILIAPFAIYYSVHAQIIYALISLGIIINCLTIVLIGLRQRFNKEQEIGWRSLRGEAERDRIGRENPHLLNDTLIITLTALLPFILAAIVLLELASQRIDHKIQKS